jgi:hypothetical protein
MFLDYCSCTSCLVFGRGLHNFSCWPHDTCEIHTSHIRCETCFPARSYMTYIYTLCSSMGVHKCIQHEVRRGCTNWVLGECYPQMRCLVEAHTTRTMFFWNVKVANTVFRGFICSMISCPNFGTRETINQCTDVLYSVMNKNHASYAWKHTEEGMDDINCLIEESSMNLSLHANFLIILLMSLISTLLLSLCHQ